MPALDAGAIASAVATPIASAPLEEVVRGARRVHLVVPDATRAAAAPQLVEAAMGALGRASIGPERVGAVFAVGLHRAPTAAEREQLLGRWARRLAVVPCDPDDGSDRRDLGRTSFGTQVWLGRRALEADRLILIGSIDFHYFAGFTGGRKAIFPGLAAAESIHANHLRVLGDGPAGRDPRVGPGRIDDNPVHLDMEDATARVDPSFLINSVTDHRGRVVRVFAGHWRLAHRYGCDWVAQWRSVQVPEARPLVVVSAGGHPKDINLIQAHKAVEHAQAAVSDGGVLVLVAECRDGMGHPQFLPWFRYREDLARFRSQLLEHYQVYGQTAFALCAKLRRYRIVLVSALPAQQVEEIGMIPATDLAQALCLAERFVGDTRGWWIPHGGAILARLA